MDASNAGEIRHHPGKGRHGKHSWPHFAHRGSVDRKDHPQPAILICYNHNSSTQNDHPIYSSTNTPIGSTNNNIGVVANSPIVILNYLRSHHSHRKPPPNTRIRPNNTHSSHVNHKHQQYPQPSPGITLPSAYNAMKHSPNAVDQQPLRASELWPQRTFSLSI